MDHKTLVKKIKKIFEQALTFTKGEVETETAEYYIKVSEHSNSMLYNGIITIHKYATNKVNATQLNTFIRKNLGGVILDQSDDKTNISIKFYAPRKKRELEDIVREIEREVKDKFDLGVR